MADDLIDAYSRMILSAHAGGIRVYGATLLPFGGSICDADYREAARRTVNTWIRNSGEFDAGIDLDAALRDPADPLRLLPAAGILKTKASVWFHPFMPANSGKSMNF